MTNVEALKQDAYAFLEQYYRETGQPLAVFEERWENVEQEIEASGHYEHTFEELSFGAKVSWRNSNRCIGRFFWKSLQVIDCRDVRTEEQAVEALRHHIRYAENDGKIIPTISVFPSVKNGKERMRIWNYQLIRYAGYERDGEIIGEPQSVAFTKYCESLGWKGEKTSFDLLPLVVQVNEGAPQWFPLKTEAVLEVPITHPDSDAFSTLGLKWYAVPIVSDMKMEIGGITYTAAPFNGWYMETEIGARNLADEDRYNMLPQAADVLGIDRTYAGSLWKDRALVEMNRAVLHSYKKAGVSMVDHHTAASQFRRFEQQEQKAGREVTGDWTWLIPPVSPAATHIFHSSYRNIMHTPNFFYQQHPYK